MALAEPADGAKDVLHRAGLAEHLGHLGGALGLHRLAQALVDGAADQLDRAGHVEGLGQVFEGPALERGDRAVEVRVGGHDDHRQRRAARLDRGQQLDAAAAGHADVRHQHLRLLGLERGQHLARVRERARLELLAGQRALEDEAYRGVVVDDPDRFHALLQAGYGRGIVILNTVRPG